MNESVSTPEAYQITNLGGVLPPWNAARRRAGTILRRLRASGPASQRLSTRRTVSAPRPNWKSSRTVATGSAAVVDVVHG